MPNRTLEEAREHLAEATHSYQEIERAISEEVAGETTPERVLRGVELQGALYDAAQELIAAKNTYEAINTETSERRRERAQAELASVEADLGEAVADAERVIGDLVPALGRVLNLSKQRYAHRQEATGRAPLSMLARNTVEGWLAWRLQGLELPDMGTPPHHYRAPLDKLLGLTPDTNTGDTTT